MTLKQSSEDRKRYDVLSRMLRDRQSEIRNKLRSLREALPTELTQVKDAEEQSMSDFVLGMDFALMEMESETLKKIDEVLFRLQDGTYGICDQCEREISEARLKALPFAVLCRDCQEVEEETVAERNARPSRFFEDGPPAAPRERRSASKAASAWDSSASRPAAGDGGGAESGALRAPKPARASRA